MQFFLLFKFDSLLPVKQGFDLPVAHGQVAIASDNGSTSKLGLTFRST